MKKLILAFVTIAFIGLGSAPAMAQTPSQKPSDCGESTVQFPGKTEYCQSVLPAVYPVAVVPPQVAPAAPTTVVAALPPIVQLPTTGNSGMSTTLGIGALLILGGGIVAVATRRRSTSSSTT